jgi:hypothetical protein
MRQSDLPGLDYQCILLFTRMKKVTIVALLLLALLGGYAQTTRLTINFQFKNIEEGYDHQTKAQVLIDGEVVGESDVTLQSKGKTFQVEVPTGEHELRVVNWALYEGQWEEHLVENEYSIDASYEAVHTFKKPEKLFLVFDLDEGSKVSWKKPVKK